MNHQNWKHAYDGKGENNTDVAEIETMLSSYIALEN